ncbi:MAG: deoxyguanosinetriphosphate triphosphohydrolase, partial [Brachybacterium sp.]|nr:deoxyguanosinetriphosphate triphosphohydrolase [Brachybacterium sp.]
ATRAAHGEGPLSRYSGDMVVPERTHLEIAVLKGLAAAYVMSSASQQPVYEAQEEIIRDLYSRLWNTGTQHLSPLFVELWHSAGDDDGRRRVVVDQIASYTDVTARQLHGALFDRSLTHVTAADTPLPGLGSEL